MKLLLLLRIPPQEEQRRVGASTRRIVRHCSRHSRPACVLYTNLLLLCKQILSTKMRMQLHECLLMALLCGAQLMDQLHAAPNNRRLFSVVNDTTTAIPLYNVSTSSTRGHTPTGTTSVPKVTLPAGTKQFPTTATFDATTGISAKLSSTAASSIIHGSTDYRQSTGQSHFDTTTAAPPFVRPVTAYREFDALSFMGGALLTICLVIIGTMVWKMYIAHVERRYWTL